MASVKIHTDLYNFKRTRKGFTDRQIKGAVLAVLLDVGVTLLLGFVCGVPYAAAAVIGTVLALPLLLGYCSNMIEDALELHMEDCLDKMQEYARRGNTVSWQGETLEPMHGEVSREYIKKTGKKAVGVELSGRVGA